MLLSKLTQRKEYVLAVEGRLHAWGGLGVTVELSSISNENEKYYFDLSKRELQDLLKKIEEREEEIDRQLGGNND